MNFLSVLIITSLVYFSATLASSIVKRDLKAELLAKAQSLENSAFIVIAQLKSEGRSQLAAALEREEKILQLLAAELKAATGEPAIRRIEAEVIAIETRIQMEIRRIETITAKPTPPKLTTHRPTSHNPTTQRPTTPSQSTPKQTTAGPTIRPTTLGNTTPIRTTPRTNTTTPSPTTLKSQTTISTIATTVSNLISIEDKLREKALKRTAALETRISAEIKKLQTSNKEALAAGLELEESRIHEVADELRKATQEEEIRVLEGELDRLELQLEIELNKIERDIGSNF